MLFSVIAIRHLMVDRQSDQLILRFLLQGRKQVTHIDRITNASRFLRIRAGQVLCAGEIRSMFPPGRRELS
jgi:hypothetical protein